MSKKATTEGFVEKANKVHNNLYSYTSTDYINAKTKVKITCSLHGNFEQAPNNHLSGQNCPKCKPKIVKSTIEQFIKKAKTVHGDIYDYTKAKYVNAQTKIEITCIKQHVFKQSPNNHLSGKGCPKCGAKRIKEYQIKNPTGWSHSNWKNAAEKSKNFCSFKVYIIRCWNDEEEFFKIGKTFTTVDYRFRNKHQMPYNYESVKIFNGEAKETCKLEYKLQKDNKQFKYSPKINFDGMYECFSKIDKNGF